MNDYDPDVLIEFRIDRKGQKVMAELIRSDDGEVSVGDIEISLGDGDPIDHALRLVEALNEQADERFEELGWNVLEAFILDGIPYRIDGYTAEVYRVDIKVSWDYWEATQ